MHMMLGMRFFVLILFGMCAELVMTQAGAAAQALEPLTLQTFAQDSAPKYYRDDTGAMQGICYDILRAVDDLDPLLTFTGQDQFLPFKRIQSRMEEGRVDVFFGFAKSARRAELFQFLDVPLYEVNLVVAVRADAKLTGATYAELREELAGRRVLTLHATATSRLLKKHGFNVFDDISNMPSLLLMLTQNRGAAVFYHDLGLHHVVNALKLQEQIRILPVSLRRYEHFVAFSRKASPEAVARVETALKLLKKNGTLDAIRRKYVQD